jgi:hypothetical protein
MTNRLKAWGPRVASAWVAKGPTTGSLDPAQTGGGGGIIYKNCDFWALESPVIFFAFLNKENILQYSHSKSTYKDKNWNFAFMYILVQQHN